MIRKRGPLSCLGVLRPAVHFCQEQMGLACHLLHVSSRVSITSVSHEFDLVQELWRLSKIVCQVLYVPSSVPRGGGDPDLASKGYARTVGLKAKKQENLGVPPDLLNQHRLWGGEGAVGPCRLF